MSDFLFRDDPDTIHIDEWEGLKAYLTSRTARPEMPTEAEYRNFDDPTQEPPSHLP